MEPTRSVEVNVKNRIQRLLEHYRTLSIADAWALSRYPAIAGGVGAGLVKDFRSNLIDDLTGNSIRPQVASSTVTGQAVDLVEADGNCFALIQVGPVSGTVPTLDVSVTESAISGGSYTAISGATFTQVTASNKSQIINFRRSLRFCKLLGTIAGTSPSFALSGQIYGRRKIVR